MKIPRAETIAHFRTVLWTLVSTCISVWYAVLMIVLFYIVIRLHGDIRELRDACECATPNASHPESEQVEALSDEVSKVKIAVGDLGRVFIQTQVAQEESTRRHGVSGLTATRSYVSAAESFSEPTFTNFGTGNMHNHAEHARTVGFGEISAVLSGVGFTSRHNDYRLRENDATQEEPAPVGAFSIDADSTGAPASDPPGKRTPYHATRNIEFPNVPPSVLAQPTVSGQIEEMKAYFRAFKEQDSRVRDYQPFFKPALCVLEGAWTEQTGNLDEPFDSDRCEAREPWRRQAMLGTGWFRPGALGAVLPAPGAEEAFPPAHRHQIDARTWRELHAKVQFFLASGRKNEDENLAHLPSSIRSLHEQPDDETWVPKVSNFEYRIHCQPLGTDVPTERFVVADDLHVQMGGVGGPVTPAELAQTRRARFQINPRTSAEWAEGTRSFPRGPHLYEYLDELMENVSGKDGPRAILWDDAAGSRARHALTGEPLNVARYSRFYSMPNKDAMGRSQNRRTFTDAHIFVARTTHERVTPVKLCEEATWAPAEGAEARCYTQRWTYAVPLEIVYMTPLSRWNPWNLTSFTGDEVEARRAATCDGTADGRSAETALCGTSETLYYRTPIEFFGAGSPDADAADTAEAATAVKDPLGQVHWTAPSGHWILTPEIEGVGRVRQRYPIFPIHAHGNVAFKEVKALAELAFARR